MLGNFNFDNSIAFAYLSVVAFDGLVETIISIDNRRTSIASDSRVQWLEVVSATLRRTPNIALMTRFLFSLE